MPLCAPELLAETHELADFASGMASLDDWLKRRAPGNQASGASRTFVVAEDRRVVAYYAIALGGIGVNSALGRFRRNMPNPIPVVLRGRLGMDRGWQERGLGRALFRDSAGRVLQAADTIGIRGIVVHSISEEARAFYLALGFEVSPLDSMMLMVTLGDVEAGFSEG